MRRPFAGSWFSLIGKARRSASTFQTFAFYKKIEEKIYLAFHRKPVKRRQQTYFLSYLCLFWTRKNFVIFHIPTDPSPQINTHWNDIRGKPMLDLIFLNSTGSLFLGQFLWQTDEGKQNFRNWLKREGGGAQWTSMW